jgi:hypothetical protein
MTISKSAEGRVDCPKVWRCRQLNRGVLLEEVYVSGGNSATAVYIVAERGVRNTVEACALHRLVTPPLAFTSPTSRPICGPVTLPLLPAASLTPLKVTEEGMFGSCLELKKHHCRRSSLFRSRPI